MAFCPTFRLCLLIMHSSFEVTFIITTLEHAKVRLSPFVFRSVFNNDDDDTVAIAVAAADDDDG